jgi:hypothetical protein
MVVFYTAPVLPPSFGWQQSFPEVLRPTQIYPKDATAWGVFSSSITPPPTSANWFMQWPIPPAKGAINVAALLNGVAWDGQPIATAVLPANVANWYLQFPIPPAKGAINVAALIDGFTWSESSKGGVVTGLHAPHFFTTMGMSIGAPTNPPS